MSRRQSKVRGRWATPSVVTILLLPGCSAINNADQPVDGTSAALATEVVHEDSDEAGVRILQGAHPPGPESVHELRDIPVVVGTIVSSRTGEATGPSDDALRPVYVTLRVDEELGGGGDLPEELVLWAQYVDGAGQRYVAQGRPWLEPGERVLTAVMPDDTEGDLYGVRGLWTTYEIVDGRLSLPDRVRASVEKDGGLPELAQQMLAMTEEQARDELRP